MKAIVKKFAQEGLWIDEVPEPTPAPNEVLVQIVKTAICGTDVNIYKWGAWAQKNVPVPLIVGHEFVGKIIEVGSAVKDLKVGQRVSAEGHLYCGQCRNCRTGTQHICRHTRGIGYHTTGCFAERFVLPASNVYPIVDTISDDLAAIFDPFGNAVHTTLSFDLVGEDVFISGAGPIGIMSVAIAKKAGARHVVITDVNPYRLALAEQMGASAAINVRTTDVKAVTASLGITEGYTVGLEMSGNPSAFTTLLEVMQPAGKVALLGILPPQTPIDWDLVIFKGLYLKGIWGREIFSTWYKMEHMLQSGLDISPVITHHFHYTDFQKGIDCMLSGSSGKVILDWSR